MIAIIDYGCGNLRSLENAFRELGIDAMIAEGKQEIQMAERIVLPGVGSFGAAMESIREKGLEEVIKKAAGEKPFLGICLGLQVLFEESEESPGIRGLGILSGRVKKFTAANKIPQMGWNQVERSKWGMLLKGIPSEQWFFFANSYFAEPGEKEIVAGNGEYGEKFCAAVEKGNIWATQFHPEKSGYWGLRILKNFAGGEKNVGKACDTLP